MSEKRTIIETIEDEIKHNFNLSHKFKRKKKSLNLESNLFSSDEDEVYSFYPLKHEYTFEYSLFKLYCFCNYSISDIYELLIDLSKKYNKSDLKSLSYSDFVKYTEDKKFKLRKDIYIKSNDEYQNKIHLKESAESDYIKYLINDYEDTVVIIENLNSDMKFICNDEDISPEKRAEYINKCEKITNRLSLKRDELIEKIRAEDL